MNNYVLISYYISFPYYSVYFKARRNKKEGIRKKDNFHTIQSILKLSKVDEVFNIILRFPYYSVYFKALAARNESDNNHQFPYYSVYFKAFFLILITHSHFLISILFSLF